VIKNDELAAGAAKIEASSRLAPKESRNLIRKSVTQRYTVSEQGD
jgi:hypothetical protein